jgi:hypothetical protein
VLDKTLETYADVTGRTDLLPEPAVAPAAAA